MITPLLCHVHTILIAVIPVGPCERGFQQTFLPGMPVSQ